MSDLIDRQELFSSLHKFFKDGFTEDRWWNSTHVLETIDKLPPVQPERETGRWMEISSLHHTYKCSECGRLLVNITDGKNNVVKHYPYCHCGCKMEVEYEYDEMGSRTKRI